MADLCLADRRNDRRWIQQEISAYRLPYQVVTDFLRHLFGENHFHVALFDDRYGIKLPRALEKHEHDQLENLRGQFDESQSVQGKARSSARERELSIPLIKASREIVFEIPIKNDDGKTKELYGLSNLHINTQGTSSSLYTVMVSKGFTSNVYAVDARWSWVQAEPIVDDALRENKVAIKKLSQVTTPEQFIQEYEALKTVTASRHRNIVSFLNAFRYEDRDKLVHYNFSFPLAAGNLKQLFHSAPAYQNRDSYPAENKPVPHQFPEGFRSRAMKRLWSEFEGLANALIWLHDYCDIVHSDIKPSNILLYESHGLEQVIVAKLTDFGLAVDLQTKTSWRLGSLACAK